MPFKGGSSGADIQGGSIAMATILVCDDATPVRQLVRTVLEREGHEIVEAADGDESIRLVRATRPDLVVLDMVMPGQSGLDVLDELRSDPTLRGMPVLLLTGSHVIANRRTACEFGASAYLAKPFSVGELLGTVEQLLPPS
jgi:CheY-like chemotaxis protein